MPALRDSAPRSDLDSRPGLDPCERCMFPSSEVFLLAASLADAGSPDAGMRYLRTAIETTEASPDLQGFELARAYFEYGLYGASMAPASRAARIEAMQWFERARSSVESNGDRMAILVALEASVAMSRVSLDAPRRAESIMRTHLHEARALDAAGHYCWPAAAYDLARLQFSRGRYSRAYATLDVQLRPLPATSPAGLASLWALYLLAARLSGETDVPLCPQTSGLPGPEAQAIAAHALVLLDAAGIAGHGAGRAIRQVLVVEGATVPKRSGVFLSPKHAVNGETPTGTSGD